MGSVWERLKDWVSDNWQQLLDWFLSFFVR